ncbi:MAG: 4'-phosphopantetheinyl transferase superfamily protein [Deltaproteobacteria bacterium]|nr:4'-phosphopantetheinyl transferase superfamily protein [Deltaproteobacteria bacterium]
MTDNFQLTKFNLANDEVHVWELEFSEDPTWVQKIFSYLTMEEQKLYQDSPTAKKKKEFLLSRGPLRFLLSRYLKRDFSQIEILRQEKGKPFVPDKAFHFNLSHSHERAVFAFCQNFEIGIDLEFLNPKRSIKKIAQRYFAESEKELIENTPQAQRERLAYQLWTAKEALMKGNGEGLELGIDQVIIPFKDQDKVIHFEEGIFKDWSLYFFSIQDEKYVASLATQSSNPKLVFFQFDF